MKILAIVLAFATVHRIVAQTGDGYAFRVHVVNSVTGAAIAGANVVVEITDSSNIWGRSDAAGLFMGHSPAAGKHVLVVSRQGYRMMGTGVMGTLFNIEPSGDNNTTVKMLPLGVIAGRVLDQYGDPVRHAIARTLQNGNLAGQDEGFTGLSAGTTDDRGEYRITDVEPGKYYVAAEYSRQNEVGRGRSRADWPEIGGIAIFPDVADIRSARLVEVSGGATTRIDDLHLKMQRAVTISGHVKPTPSESVLNLTLHRAGPGLGLNASAIHGGRTEPDGSFAYHVLPGMYVLAASDQKTGKVSKNINVDARDKDVANVVVTLDSSYEISGRIIVDGPESLDFSKLNLNFLGGAAKIGSDGSFHANAFGSKAMYLLQGLPEDWYVKQVTVGGQPLLGRRFEANPGTTEVSFTLNAHGARVEFTPPQTGNKLDTAFMVMLLSETGPEPDPESMLSAEPGSGKLVVRGVPPGSYRVFALDATNYVYAFNPNMLMEKYGKSAPLVTVASGEHKTLAVTPTKIEPE